MDVCGGGVTGFKDMLSNTKLFNEKIRTAFELENGNQPEKTFKEYTP